MDATSRRLGRRPYRSGVDGRIAHRSRLRAFTLTELMIGSSLSVIVLAGVLSAFLLLGRSGVNAANYSESEANIRRAIEDFSQDVRMARDIVWNSATSITLTVPDNYSTSSNQVTYAWDSSTIGLTPQSFYRKPGDAAFTADPTVYVRKVTSFTFLRFNRLDGTAANNAETKRIQLSMNVNRSGSTLVGTNAALVSASFILRNKVAN